MTKKRKFNRSENCTVVNVTVERNVPRYAAQYLNPHRLKNRVSCYLDQEV